MNIKRNMGIGIGVFFTTLLSPAIGTIGLVCTGFRALYDSTARRLATKALKSAQQKPTPKTSEEQLKLQGRISKLKEKVAYYDSRLSENKYYARNFGWMLIPLVGFPIAVRRGDFTASLVTTIADLASPKRARKMIYKLSGKTFETYAKERQPREKEKLKLLKVKLENITLDLEKTFDPERKALLENERAFLKSDVEKLSSKRYRKDPVAFLKKRRKLWIKRFCTTDPTTNEPLKGENFKLPRSDGQKIDVVWLPGKNVSPNAPTVVLFHGIGAILDSNFEKAKFYHDLGLNTFLITMGGYPGSAEGTETTEESCYRDVKAVADYLKKKQVPAEQILAHGISMGGSLATAFCSISPGSHLLAQETFVDIHSVAKNIIAHNPWLPSKGAQGPVERLIKRAFPKGITYEEFTTDGLSNIEKIGKIKGLVRLIRSQNDYLMTLRNDKGKNVTHTADILAQARLNGLREEFQQRSKALKSLKKRIKQKTLKKTVGVRQEIHRLNREIKELIAKTTKTKDAVSEIPGKHCETNFWDSPQALQEINLFLLQSEMINPDRLLEVLEQRLILGSISNQTVNNILASFPFDTTSDPYRRLHRLL